jgi:hypothetical protein
VAPTWTAADRRQAAPGKLCLTPFGGPDATIKFVMRVVATAGDPETITVPAGRVYVAGDNRKAPHDSRVGRALPMAQVLGRHVRSAGTCGCRSGSCNEAVRR